MAASGLGPVKLFLILALATLLPVFLFIPGFLFGNSIGATLVALLCAVPSYLLLRLSTGADKIKSLWIAGIMALPLVLFGLNNSLKNVSDDAAVFLAPLPSLVLICFMPAVKGEKIVGGLCLFLYAVLLLTTWNMWGMLTGGKL